MRIFNFDVETVPNGRHSDSSSTSLSDEKDLEKWLAIIPVSLEDFVNGNIKGWLGPHNDRIVLI